MKYLLFVFIGLFQLNSRALTREQEFTQVQSILAKTYPSFNLINQVLISQDPNIIRSVFKLKGVNAPNGVRGVTSLFNFQDSLEIYFFFYSYQNGKLQVQPLLALSPFEQQDLIRHGGPQLINTIMMGKERRFLPIPLRTWVWDQLIKLL